MENVGELKPNMWKRGQVEFKKEEEEEDEELM